MGEPGRRERAEGRPHRPDAPDQRDGPDLEDRPDRSPPEQQPAHVDLYRTVVVGTIAWLVVVLVLLPFVGRLANADRGWWLQTAIAGVLLGLVGMAYARRRR